MESTKDLFSEKHCFKNDRTDIVIEKVNVNKFFSGGSMMKKAFFCLFFLSILNVTPISLASKTSETTERPVTPPKGCKAYGDPSDFVQKRSAFSLFIDNDFVQRESDFVQR